MRAHDFAGIKRDLHDLERRIDREVASREAHGTLDGEARLVARDAAIEIAAIKERLAHYGDPDVEQHAIDAADLMALRTQLDGWTARIDRTFKD